MSAARATTLAMSWHPRRGSSFSWAGHAQPAPVVLRAQLSVPGRCAGHDEGLRLRLQLCCCAGSAPCTTGADDRRSEGGRARSQCFLFSLRCLVNVPRRRRGPASASASGDRAARKKVVLQEVRPDFLFGAGARSSLAQASAGGPGRRARRKRGRMLADGWIFFLFDGGSMGAQSKEMEQKDRDGTCPNVFLVSCAVGTERARRFCSKLILSTTDSCVEPYEGYRGIG